jgi:tripartite ATP-independent transporter DctM subunit
MTGNEVMVAVMVIGVCGALMCGFPVAFTLTGASMVFGLIGYFFDIFSLSFFGVLPNRIFGVMTNEVLIAVPLFVFMGVMLERSKVAEELLDTMGALFGTMRGGLGISVCVVGALLAASTGIVGATVVTMGLLSLPTMLRRGYDPKMATGVIAASGTLGQIIPPSIVLVVLGDQISNAHQEAQRSLGNWSPDPVSVGDLFAGALLPGLGLVGLYMLYTGVICWLKPELGPAIPREELLTDASGGLLSRVLHAMVAPAVLIIAVLGSILAGIATPTEAAAVGAIGATLLGGYRLGSDRPQPIYTAVFSLVAILILVANVDLRVARTVITGVEWAAIIAAGIACAGVAWGMLVSFARVHGNGTLVEVNRQTIRISAMVFGIVIGAQLFSLVFRGFGGDEIVHEILSDLPGGTIGAVFVVMLVLFILGFFLDFIEITFVVVPIVAPILLMMDLNPVWLGIMIAINLQTSFLTPPFGFALFYLRGVAPPEVTTGMIYKGIIPFVMIQIFMLVLLSVFPGMATWLPSVIYGTS